MKKVKLVRKKLPNRKGNKAVGVIIARTAAIAAILFGTWLLLSNLYQFSKGILAAKTISANELPEISSIDNASGVEEGKSVANDFSGKYSVSVKKNNHDKENLKKQVLYQKRPDTGDHVGKLYIPKLNRSLPIYEGTEAEELEQGVGHYTDSVLPGESDNCVLSGHRDTVFRKLGDIGKGDLLIVKTSAGEFQYMVTKVRIVDADDRTVIVPKPKATLTVSTCYPFDYIGSAPKRYILVASLVDKTQN
jgi:sortase A